jgi:phage terminase large subunit
MTIKPNPLPPFKPLYQLPAGTWMIFNVGGRGGGKTYEISKWCNLGAMTSDRRTVVLRDEKTTISDSILNEIKNRYNELNEKANGYFDTVYDFQTHEMKKKKTAVDPEKKLIFTKGFRASSNSKTANLKSISDIDIAIIEEGEDVTDKQAFNRFADGIRNQNSIIVVNMNTPDMNHFFIQGYYDLDDTEHDGYFKLRPKNIPGVVYIFSDYSTNPHLPDHIIRKYKAYGDPDSPFYDKHYYLTQILGYCSAGRTGQIYTGWKRITNSQFNEIAVKSVFGLDFGWSDSPMALSELKVEGGRCYKRQLIYERNMTLLDLAVRLIQLKITGNDLIVADSAEPLTINKLRNGWQVNELPAGYAEKYPQLLSGFYIMPAVKGPGSIQAGINRVKEYENYLTEDSIDWWNEYVQYCWAKDKNGHPTDEPLDDFNHLFDSDRYAIMAKGRLY